MLGVDLVDRPLPSGKRSDRPGRHRARRSHLRGLLRIFRVVFIASLGVIGSAEARSEDREVGYTADELLPFEPRQALFQHDRPREKTSEQVLWSRAPVEGEGNRYRIEVPGVSAALLERAEDGSIRIISHWDHRKGHRIDYDPPTLLLPARLVAGEEHEVVSQVVVYDTRDGSREASGKCIHRVRLVAGGERLSTPGGELEVVRVDLTREVDVPIAKARVTVELGFVPGVGRVLERTLEELSFFGFVGRREQSNLRLIEERAVAHE
jgi:hypothetical protein